MRTDLPKPVRILPLTSRGARWGKTTAYNHWAIENQNHWVRDVTLAEDASRIRINPGIMARLRSQALNIARANGVTNIAEALWIAAIDPSISLSYSGL